MILQGFWALPEIFYEYIINILFINTLIKYNCTLVIDGELWFIGKDIAEILGYTNSRKALTDHVDEEDKRTIQKSHFVTLEIPNRGMMIINESGPYSLILSSKLQNAKRFKHWVTAKVLPAIHKTGGYINNLYDMVYSETLCLLYIVLCSCYIILYICNSYIRTNYCDIIF